MANPRSVAILLPALAELRGGLPQAPKLSRRLAQAERLPLASAGRQAQLLRHFDVLPRSLAAAPLTRALDADDAHLGHWLRCDPAYVRADMSTARLLALGDGLALDSAEVDALVQPLRPLFGDFGFPLSTPVAQRWYLSLPAGTPLPTMAAPREVLGDDLLPHLPAGREGLRWRQLWNEAQIVLHQHPLNAARIAAGKPPVNSVWIWGGGGLPDRVQARRSAVVSVDPLLHGLAKQATVPLMASEAAWQHGDSLFDLDGVRDIDELERHLLPELLQRLGDRSVAVVELDFADGRRFALTSRQRWRVWRRAMPDWSDHDDG